jgi:hypothetical protein
MRRVRGGLFVTGKSEGEADIVMASVEEVGVCWARQEDMLFTELLVWVVWISGRRTEDYAVA